MDNAGPIINPLSFSRRELGKTMFKLPKRQPQILCIARAGIKQNPG